MHIYVFEYINISSYWPFRIKLWACFVCFWGTAIQKCGETAFGCFGCSSGGKGCGWTN